jgi:hypothetical protein
MRWTGYVVLMGELHIEFLSENLNGRDHLGDTGVDLRIILK